MRVLEKTVQRKVNAWCEAHGVHYTVLTLRGRRGWPDVIYWLPSGNAYLIEYKRPGEKPRKLQAYVHNLLKELGYQVEVHTIAEEAISSIKGKLI